MESVKKDFQNADGKSTIGDYLKKYYKNHFKFYLRVLNYEDAYRNVELSDVRKVLHIKTIKANREVAGESSSGRGAGNQRLSKLSSDYYRRTEEVDKEYVDEFRNYLLQTDQEFTKKYRGIFSDLVNKVKQFGGMQEGESKIEIISSLSETNLISGNTSVVYDYEGHKLPENYNGLGYMNLIAIIFQIAIVMKSFQKFQKDNLPDICLFFIEEPEVHTHPQMQRIFIKKIKELLDSFNQFSLQTIMSTHSAYIASESDFDDIKYFLRKSNKSAVYAKDLKSLKDSYEQDQYNFLRKYLTITRAELFFADKAILIEGDTERMMLPAMISKLDIKLSNSDSFNLSSQNISIIKVGSHSHIFQKLIAFLDIKCLIITDLDAVGKDGKACSIDEGVSTSNPSLKSFFGDRELNYFKSLSLKDRILNIQNDGNFKADPKGNIMITYQRLENNSNYYPRSFEEAFININMSFMRKNLDDFKSLKNKPHFNKGSKKSSYELAKCVKKKTDFVVDIIYLSDSNYGNWDIPLYIKEGLEWLRK